MTLPLNVTLPVDPAMVRDLPPVPVPETVLSKTESPAVVRVVSPVIDTGPTEVIPPAVVVIDPLSASSNPVWLSMDWPTVSAVVVPLT